MEKIFLGCPVHNREWILPLYLKHIYNIDYPKHNITLCFILNDSKDRSKEILLDFKKSYEAEYREIIVKEINFNMPDDLRQNRIKNKIYERLANVRNEFLSCIKDEDYVFSIDSDILVPKDSLLRLLSHKKDIVSAIVYNDPKKKYPNILIIKNGRITHFIDFPKNSLFEVDITGAVYLLKSEICKKVKYEYHSFGEDVPFCISAKKLGYKIWCDSSIFCNHVMYPYMLK
ncbi:glycosyltransferase [Caloramator sp. E03]|uniref:glycosyltransferase n=1 Tax=Caloramator sp. E03 TaxID=2576307 RepID=UPI00111048E0|nr:glycosyltransferase family 2 protein [Caloramator sp. E03]QCX32930.1 glycosyltransferase [Caloramator sp. E03]